MEVKKYSPDSHQLPITCLAYNSLLKKLYTGSEDSTIKVWDENGKLERVLTKHEGWVTDILFCERYNILFSCSLDGTIVAWSPNMKPFYERRVNVPCSCLAWERKRKLLAVGLKDYIHVYRINRNRYDANAELLEQIVALKLSKTGDFVKCMICYDGKLLCGSFDQTISIFEALTGRTIMKIPKAHKGAISAIAHDPDNSRFITGGFDKRVKVWNNDGTVVYEIAGFQDIITGMCYNPITKTLWVSANSVRPQVFDPLTGNEITEYVSGILPPFEIGTVQHLKFLPATSEIVGTTLPKHGLITWKHNPYTPLTTIKASNEVIETLTYYYVRGTVQVFVAGADKVVKRWEVRESDAQVDPGEGYIGHRDAISSSFFYEPLEILITGSADKTIRLWSYSALPSGPARDSARKSNRPTVQLPLATPNRDPADPLARIEAYGLSWLNQKISGLDYKYVLEGHTDRVTGLVAFKKENNHFLLSASWDLSIILWDLNRDMYHFKKTITNAHEDYLLDIDYCPERNEFATSSADTLAKIWNFETLECVAVLRGHDGEVVKIRWNKIMQLWVTGGDDNTIRTWDVFGIPHRVVETVGGITALCIDKSQGHAVASTTDHVIRVYDLKTDAILQENSGHADVITCIVHAQYANYYISSSWDQTVRVWIALKEKLVTNSMASSLPEKPKKPFYIYDEDEPTMNAQTEKAAERFQITLKAADNRITHAWEKRSNTLHQKSKVKENIIVKKKMIQQTQYLDTKQTVSLIAEMHGTSSTSHSQSKGRPRADILKLTKLPPVSLHRTY